MRDNSSLRQLLFRSLACYFGDDYVNLVQGGQRQIRNLKVGDCVWSLSHDGHQLIEDEIMSIPHAGPTALNQSNFNLK